MTISINKRLALALDNIDKKKDIESLIALTAPWIGTYKIGLEQYIRFGPPILDVIRNAKRSIFLDLKLHDIPNTVSRAVLSSCDLGVDYLTVHTLGGSEMIRLAVKTRNERCGSQSGPRVIGVTLLTSIGDKELQEDLHVNMGLQDYVRFLAEQAVKAGADGIVCSAADLPFIKPNLPSRCIFITPGIRPAGSDSNDQRRVSTPSDALRAGATILVLGRAVTSAADPALAVKKIHNEVCNIVDS